MTTRRILFRYVDAEPFQPFRMRMTSGELFEVRHPEMIQVGRTTATVFTWMSDDDEHPGEREREISILLIESIEPLRATSTQDREQSPENRETDRRNRIPRRHVSCVAQQTQAVVRGQRLPDRH